MYNVLFLVAILPQLAKCTLPTYQTVHIEATNNFIECLEKLNLMEGIFAKRCKVVPWCNKNSVYTKLNSLERHLMSKGNRNQASGRVLSLVDVVCNEFNIKLVGSKKQCTQLTNDCTYEFCEDILEFHETEKNVPAYLVNILEVPELPEPVRAAYEANASNSFFECLNEFLVYDAILSDGPIVPKWEKEVHICQKLDGLASYIISEKGDTSKATDKISDLVNVACNEVNIELVDSVEKCIELTNNCAVGFGAAISESYTTRHNNIMLS